MNNVRRIDSLFHCSIKIVRECTIFLSHRTFSPAARRSVSLVPCDLVQGADDAALEALEDEGEMTTDDVANIQCRVDSLGLTGQRPTVITIVSPSGTSSPRGADDEPAGRTLPRSRTNLRRSPSPPPPAAKTVRHREPKSRRMRRTPAANRHYPRMSWKRAHDVVQRRRRDADATRRTLMSVSSSSSSTSSSNRPLEANPGWTPLQKAIIVSNALLGNAYIMFSIKVALNPGYIYIFLLFSAGID